MHSPRILRLWTSILLLALLAGCGMPAGLGEAPSETATVYSSDRLPEYSGSPYVIVNDNQPEFAEEQFTTEAYEFYTDLDQLGRCGACYANIGQELMPTEERESISLVHPSGWVQAQYDCVEGNNLYNRCHLIGFQLTGENSNNHNLITGTRYLNVEGMLPFENQLAEYIKRTGHHVLYRVTPDFQGEELVARGVELEAASVEDQEIRFHVYCYNVQPGVEIDYATGESWLSGTTVDSPQTPENGVQEQYVLNTKNLKFHRPDCSSVETMSQGNRQDYTGSRETLIEQGYSPCGRCNP